LGCIKDKPLPNIPTNRFIQACSAGLFLLVLTACGKEPSTHQPPPIPKPPTVTQPHFSATGVRQPEPAEVYKGLRSAILALKPSDLSPPIEDGSPYVLLMETGYDGAVVTLVCVVDGTTSLYFSNGGGRIGCGEHAPVREANRALMAKLPASLTHFQKTSLTPLPSLGQTVFYVVFAEGVLASPIISESDLGNSRSEFSPLFQLCQDVITQVRLLPEN